MVCKKSLYCWKNGPCASDQTRKQIWEDNIRFRESLRDINQSDHYWSFQISKNSCLCLEGEELYCGRPLSRTHRSISLQKLHQIDCTSCTHDFNGLKSRNCFVHCPISRPVGRADTPMPQSFNTKDLISGSKYALKPLSKSDGAKPEYCHRYKNTLTSLKPLTKSKFSSQTNLTSLQDNKNSIIKKSLNASCENLTKLKKSHAVSPIILTTKAEPKKVESKQNCDELKVSENITRNKDQDKELNPVTKLPKKENLREYTPVSRTTRKMLNENKPVPFVTYGCNNNNLDIGSKKTHNVLASKLEVYPNALSAKQQKKNWILKYIQSEKEFQKKCLPENIRKRLVNHSSLWSIDNITREKSFQKKPSSYSFPLMNKPVKKTYFPNQYDSSYYKTYRKPQIYFY